MPTQMKVVYTNCSKNKTWKWSKKTEWNWSFTCTTNISIDF